jgi:hypothetical protein
MKNVMRTVLRIECCKAVLMRVHFRLRSSALQRCSLQHASLRPPNKPRRAPQIAFPGRFGVVLLCAAKAHHNWDKLVSVVLVSVVLVSEMVLVSEVLLSVVLLSLVLLSLVLVSVVLVSVCSQS